jgi:hypothetical protein
MHSQITHAAVLAVELDHAFPVDRLLRIKIAAVKKSGVDLDNPAKHASFDHFPNSLRPPGRTKIAPRSARTLSDSDAARRGLPHSPANLFQTAFHPADAFLTGSPRRKPPGAGGVAPQHIPPQLRDLPAAHCNRSCTA